MKKQKNSFKNRLICTCHEKPHRIFCPCGFDSYFSEEYKLKHKRFNNEQRTNN